MIIHGQFYDGIVGKPDLDDALEHYGVLGMKWGVRKNPEKAYSKARAKSEKLSKKYSKAYDKYLKKAKKNRVFPIKLASTRSVAKARAKADLIDAKKKKWDEAVEKAFKGTKYDKEETEWDKIRKLPKSEATKKYLDIAKNKDIWDLDFLEATQNSSWTENHMDGTMSDSAYKKKMLQEYKKYLDDSEEYWKNR